MSAKFYIEKDRKRVSIVIVNEEGETLTYELGSFHDGQAKAIFKAFESYGHDVTLGSYKGGL